MHENINEKISQFLDDDLDANAALNLLQEMQHDDKLRRKLLRYEIMSQALKTETIAQPKSDFLDRIQQEIAQEPTYFLPQRQATHKQERFKPQHKALALVASAAALAVILPSHFTGNFTSEFSASTATVARNKASSERAMLAMKKNTPSAQASINEQINAYLQAQNKKSSTNNDNPYNNAFTQRAAYGSE